MLRSTIQRIRNRNILNAKKVSSSKFIQKSDVEIHLEHISKAVDNNKIQLINDLKNYGFAIVDNFLGLDYCKKYRQEAETLYKNGINLLL